MTAEQFCYWLQGLLEDSRVAQLDAVQTKMVRDHLSTVFLNVAGDPDLLKKLMEEAAKQPAVTQPLTQRWDRYTPDRTTLLC